ncbi:DUF6059 family protein [Actinomadura welshii]|uniref:Uncharacterized protein n=2 Tax=Actinomadura livida TaxID=79909 RepID=A0A7W7IEY6_9ACTN|nr:hypothetical protein [Actinomadura catellatispora]GGU39345.1 hypothetical protein GCM10010208_74480 [Actinomadura livida]
MADRHRLRRFLDRFMYDVGCGWCVFFGYPLPPWCVPPDPAASADLPPGHPECMCKTPPSPEERRLWDQM